MNTKPGFEAPQRARRTRDGEYTMKPLSKANPLGLGLAAALFAIGSPVVMAQDATSEDDSDAVETIVVTGSRFEQNIEDVAGTISVMTGADIENQLVTNMTELFRYEPGINITGSNATAQNIVVRGMGADRVMMIRDGMRMNEGYGADGMNDVVGRGFIDMDTVKQVEVAKGAASSLYGADALGGIVLFVTKDASDYLREDNFHVGVSATQEGRSDETGLGLQTAFRLGSFDTLVSFKDRSGNETKNFTDEREHAEVDSTSLLVKTDFNISENRTLTFSFDQYKKDVARPDNGEPKGNYVGLPGWTINLQESMQEQTNDAYGIRYRSNGSGLSFMDNLDVNLYRNEMEQSDVFHLNHDTPAPMGPGGSRDQFKTDLFSQDTTGLSVALGKQLGDHDKSHHLSYGFDWDTSETSRPRREVRVQDGTTVTMDDLNAPFPKNDTDRLGIYLQDTFSVGEAITITPGLRYDYYSMEPKPDEGYDNSTGGGDVGLDKISDSHTSWRLGTSYRFSDAVTFSFQYSQGFKVPPYDLAYFYFDHVAFSGNGIRIIPATSLVPEESDSYEFRFRGDIGDFYYDVSAYLADYENFIQIGFVETVSEINMDFGFPFPIDVDVFQYQNIDAAEISGLELRLGYSMTEDLNVFMNAEWMDSEDKGTGEQLTTIQPFSTTFGVNWRKGRFAMDGYFRVVDDMGKNPTGTFTTSSYETLDLYARFAITEKLRVNVGLLNALDEEYIEYSNVAGIPDDGRDLNLYTEPGRTFSAGVRFDF